METPQPKDGQILRPNLYLFFFPKWANKFKLKGELNHPSAPLTSFGNGYHALTGATAASPV